MAAVWPAASEWVDLPARLRLMASYVRRRRYEARLQASEIASIFSAPIDDTPIDDGRVSASQLLAQMGIAL